MKAPGEKLLIRLSDTIASAFGELLGPWQIRRTARAKADARRDQRLMLAQAARDANDILAGRKSLDVDRQLVAGPGNDAPSATVALATAAQRSLMAQQMRAEVNVARAVLVAEDVLEDDPQEPPGRRVDDDWLHRWRESAGKVSIEELQDLWGRVLAGEIKSPGTFSLRTLEFLKNLSKQEAAEIATLAPFVVDGDWVFMGVADDMSTLETEGIALGFS
ncbi:MAG: DUF2806 domain-containing protein [Chloroflexota bacterium]|nr:DUF2806 domain-containing protein [Chloroflexota bacterium]